MSLFDFNGACGSNMINGFTTNYAQIITDVGTIPASGATPLAQAIMDAADYSNSSATNRHTMMIVVSDGEETCGGNVVAAAQYAAPKVQQICTVGLEQGGDGASELTQVAQIGHCQYYAARNEQQLDMYLRQLYFGNLQKEDVLLTIEVWQ
jgi:Ca-activated chloride channel family protein